MAVVVQSFEFALAGGLTATNVTVNKPTGVAVGDLLILLVGNEDNTATASFAAKTGWTKQYEFGDATPDTKIGCYTRIADGTEGASETIDWNATGADAGGAWYLRVTGHDPTVYWDTLGTSSQTASATSQAAASITPSVDGCLVFAHHSFDGGDGTRSVSGTNWPSSFPANQELYDTIATTAWSGGWVTQLQTSAVPSNDATFATTTADGMVQVQFAIAPIQEGISTVTPAEFDYDEPSIDVAGLNFLATQTTATVYISDAATLAGSANEVDITSAVNTWSDSNINLDLTLLSAGELASLQTLGPGARFIIVLTSTPDEYSKAVTTHRPQAFEMALGAATPGTTTARLTGLTGTFGGGRIEETAAQNPSTTTTDVAANGNREDVWSIQGKTLSREVQYDFRVLYGGIEATSYTVTPKVTIGAAGGASGAASIPAVTASGVAKVIRKASGAVALAAVVAAGSAYIWPKVYLNTTQTLAGATEMTVTAANEAGTSITFTDPVGAPTGSLFLGVENRNNSNVAWIAVTVDVLGGKTASGAATITPVASSGAAKIIKPASGSASIASIVSAGAATIRKLSSGAASIPIVTASGSAKIIKNASGAATITPIVASGAAAVTGFTTASGNPSLTPVTASGTATIRRTASGAASITAITANGSASIVNIANGAASITAITASGAAKVKKTASGAASIPPITASGSASVINIASGAATIPIVTASGAAKITRHASGAASITAPFGTGSGGTVGFVSGSGNVSITPIQASGAAKVIKSASGAASITSITASGNASINNVSSGAASISPITASGSAKVRKQASGAASITSVFANGSANIQGSVSAAGAASITPIAASGSASVQGVKTASGNATIPSVAANGSAKMTRHANGAASITAITASGNANVGNFKSANGFVSITPIVASGNAKVRKTSSGAATIPTIAANGSAKLIHSATIGTPLAIYDDFNRPGPDIGTDWKTIFWNNDTGPTSWLMRPIIVGGNRVQQDPLLGPEYQYSGAWHNSKLPEDHYAECTVTNWDTDNYGATLYLYIRGNSDDNNNSCYYLAAAGSVTDSTFGVSIHKWNSGPPATFPTIKATVQLNTVGQVADGTRFRISAVGNVISTYWDRGNGWEFISSVVDNSFTGVSVGFELEARDPNGMALDDFGAGTFGPMVPFFSASGAAKIIKNADGSPNLVLQSLDYSAVKPFWDLDFNFREAITDSNVTLDSRGELKADRMRDLNIGGLGAVKLEQFDIPVAIGGHTHVVYVEAKADTLDWTYLQIANLGSLFIGAYFDLTNGVVGTASLGTDNISEFCIDLENGWWRCGIVFPSDVADPLLSLRHFAAAGDGVAILPLDGTSSIFLGGSQVKRGDKPTNFIETFAEYVNGASTPLITASGIAIVGGVPVFETFELIGYVIDTNEIGYHMPVCDLIGYVIDSELSGRK